MRTALHLLLLLIPNGGCTGGPTFTTKTVAVGQNVSMECPRDTSTFQDHLFWIRLVSGSFPERLAETTAFDLTEPHLWPSNSGHRITAKKEPGMFVLQIDQVQKSDMGVYYCFNSTTWGYNVTFVQGIFLQVKDFPETEPSVSLDLPSDAGPPGSPVTLRCSVVSHPGNKMCTDGHVYWFRAGTDAAHPSFVYAHKQCGEVVGGSMQKCDHVFSTDVTSSDAGTYFCAVARCGEIFMRSAKIAIIEVCSTSDLLKSVIFILGAASALIFILSAFLIFKIKTKRCFCCKACPQSHDERPNGVQQRDEDAVVYSLPTIVARKRGKTGQTNARPTEEFSTYTDVCLRN
ncbi:uncharacterized protein LOC133484691 [Phyllopteryx taeniolatus]|uniref:uncharacterized protein LOC133484691 n=1 Tax=Phyllopteryx taeniolatus TaxID=161469 RepID=UPI002AD3B6B1|nr:uncharacterized protein LOC133484691 [Phyllopteryx taeniolatus]